MYGGDQLFTMFGEGNTIFFCRHLTSV